MPYLWFAPLDVAEGADTFAPHTLGALMAERFEVYKREAVARFYEEHFRHYRRQIVLVDVLRALLAGRDAFDDTRLALAAILDSFRYGHGGLMSRLLNGPHIDKVLFAATKADHVPEIQRDHLAALLRNMAAFPALDVMASNAQMEAMATRLGDLDRRGHAGDRRTPGAGGDRPAGRRQASSRSSSSATCRSVRRAPTNGRRRSSTCRCSSRRPIDPSPVEGIPHINLDSALEFLLGDQLR